MRVQAPFTDDQVRLIKAWQMMEGVHELVCTQCKSIYRVRKGGLYCPRCGHVQDWVPGVVVSETAQQMQREIIEEMKKSQER